MTTAEASLYVLGPGFWRQPVSPWQRQGDDPLYRPLRIYTVDPSVPRLDGAIATVDVPFEPLQVVPGQGLVGRLFCVSPLNRARNVEYRCADLDERNVLIADGYAPSAADPRFHQQMVYAVCSLVYHNFRSALGRDPEWGFGSAEQPVPLQLYPHFGHEKNACYVPADDRQSGEIHFGWFRASEQATGNTLPGGHIFTSLSHDIIAHEVSHALLDGLRPHFCIPLSADALAFHEAFADLVAIFQHFSYREVVLAAIRQNRGQLASDGLLSQLARQFNQASGRHGGLRSAIDADDGQPECYNPDMEPHALGAVLVSAVFETFTRLFERKTARYLRLATGGSGVLPPGELPHDLQELLAEQASALAREFLGICIRATDYCPPVAISFGDYLRALITADRDAVPDDRWDYRGALIESFRRRNIYPNGVANLSEDALLWRAPQRPLPPVPGLDFASLRFSGDPAHAACPEERQRQAHQLGQYLIEERRLEEFGLVLPGDPRLDGDEVSLPSIQSIRTARRVGPDKQVAFDLVAEIIQKRQVKATESSPAFTFHGGATLILGPKGEVRYVIAKSVVGAGRVERRRQFVTGPQGSRFWGNDESGRLRPRGNFFRMAHDLE